jgi:Ala-tRNA(Pro) deacylase
MKFPRLRDLLHLAEDHSPCKVENLLRDNHVWFSIHHHPAAYTAQELAACEHIPGKMVTKVVIAFADENMVMLALPAPEKVNLLKLAEEMGTDNVRLASEAEFAGAFPDCEVGAMPPFGNLYGMPVLVDRTLAEDERIVFAAGTHTDTIELRYRDFAELAHPRVADFATAA